MGLDITSQKDYARFNWSGARKFQQWSEKHLHQNPFIQWAGSNGEEVVLKGEALKEATTWMTNLEKYIDHINDEDLLHYHTSQLIGEIAARMYALGQKEAGVKDQWYKPSQIEWDYIQAIKWYKLLEDAINSDGRIFYGHIINFINNYSEKHN